MSNIGKITYRASRSAKELRRPIFVEGKATVRTSPCLFARWNLIATLLVVCLPSFCVTTIAQDNTQPKSKPPILKIDVVDENGKPVKGAAITLRTAYHLRQPPLQSSELVLNKSLKLTDDQGQSSLDIPLAYDYSQVTKVNLDVSHPAYVEQNTDIDVTSLEATIVLERGWLISTSGIDAETKEPVTGSLYASTNLGPWIDWDQRWTAQLHSPRVGREVTSFRLIEIIEEKPTRFSDLIEVEHIEKQRLHYHELEMKRAITVTGKLIDQDQRPVANGLVTACVVDAGKSDNAPSKGKLSWCWRTIVHSKEDGSFVLEGIPANSVLQIIASGKASSNTRLSDEEMREHFPQALDGDHSVLPQLVHIGEEDRDITVAMQPLGRVTIKVVDSAMQPVAGARIGYTSAQTFLYSGKSELFVHRFSSARRLLWLRNSLMKWSDSRIRSSIKFCRFIRNREQRGRDSNLKTNPNGVVVPPGLPAGRTNIRVSCPEGYVGPDGKHSVSIRETIKSNENIDVTVQLKRVEANEVAELPNGKND